jgi:hypothetical protein
MAPRTEVVMANGNRQLTLGACALAFLTTACGGAASPQGSAPAERGGAGSFVTVADGPVKSRERGRTPVPGAAVQAGDVRPTPAFTGLQTPIPFGTPFDGIGVGLENYTPTWFPPDTTGAVGKNHYVQMVNASYAVFDKVTGAKLKGPISIQDLFQDLPDPTGKDLCRTDGSGDPSILYDHLADRWVLTQFAWTDVVANGFFECVAVSKTPDPTGDWWPYSFRHDNRFIDYPKVALWTDTYFVTYALYDKPGKEGKFVGARICALDQRAMLNGNRPVREVCLPDRPLEEGLLLTATLDGMTAPPKGSPAFAYGLGGDGTYLNLYRIRVNWDPSASIQLEGAPVALPVETFSSLVCTEALGWPNCVPQPGTSTKLDAMPGRPMDRFAYRNFDTHQSLVANHTVGASGPAGVRWYEIRDPSGTPVVYQQGTVTPDATYRWMGSIAMDKFGNMAVGYSVGSASMAPSIAVSGRLSKDTLGTMPQGETILQAGSGVQAGTNPKVDYTRWGDYSSMTVDPVDECTFYYTNEYLRTTGGVNWSTKVGKFSFPGCGQPADFSISATPASMSITQGGSSQSVISTTKVGSASTVSIAATISPSGTGITATLDKTFVAAGESATLTVTTSSSATAGSYTVTVTGTGPDGAPVHTTPVTLVVAAAPSGGGGCSSTGGAEGSILPLLALLLLRRQPCRGRSRRR